MHPETSVVTFLPRQVSCCPSAQAPGEQEGFAPGFRAPHIRRVRDAPRGARASSP